MLFKSIVLSLSILSYSSFGSDLGVWGDVQPILEPDLRETLMNVVDEVELNNKTEAFKSKMKEDPFQDLPKPSLGFVTKFKVNMYSPEIELSEDIVAPFMTQDGQYVKDYVYAKKGTKYNPLKVMTTGEMMFFFDANNQSQVDFANKITQDYSPFMRPVVGAGSLNDLIKKEKKMYFYAYPFLTDKLHITKLPSLWLTGKDKYQGYYFVIEMDKLDKKVIDWYSKTMYETSKMPKAK